MSEGLKCTITKQTLPGFFCKAWVSAITPANMISGFVATSIYPINPNAIPQSAFALNTSVQQPKNDLVVPISTPETPNLDAQKVVVTADVYAIPVQNSDLVVV